MTNTATTEASTTCPACGLWIDPWGDHRRSGCTGTSARRQFLVALAEAWASITELTPVPADLADGLTFATDRDTLTLSLRAGSPDVLATYTVEVGSGYQTGTRVITAGADTDEAAGELASFLDDVASA